MCKSDPGYRNSWTTFLKARLECSIPGDQPFHFDEIQSITPVVEGGPSLPSKTSSAKKAGRWFYAVLTTPENSISGSAVCAFSIDQLNKV